MKFIEKMTLTIFSMVILILSLVLSLMLFNWVEVSYIYYIFQLLVSNPTTTNVTLIILVIFMLLAIKCMCFPSYSKEKNEKTEGILLENESGKLLISIETIENLVKGVIAGFPSVKAANCKVKLDKQVNNVLIDLNIVVTSEAIIKDLSSNLQSKIKDTIKKTTEIEVKQINIRVKDIETPKD